MATAAAALSSAYEEARARAVLLEAQWLAHGEACLACADFGGRSGECPQGASLRHDTYRAAMRGINLYYLALEAADAAAQEA